MPVRPEWLRSVSITRIGLHLLPSIVVVALLLDAIGGVAGAILAFGAVLIAPGWLLWKLLGGPLSRDLLALPALWLVTSFTVLAPALAVMVFWGGPTVAVEWYALVALTGLGVAGSLVPSPQIATLGRPGAGVVALAALAMVYRAMLWSFPGDELTFLGYIRATSQGSYPSTNPFLSGALPLNPRWRFSGWTGSTGVVSHVGDADPQLVLDTILPTLLVAVAASAIFLFVKVLSRDHRLSLTAAAAVLVVPLMVGTSGKTDFHFVYKVIEFDKFTTMVIFAPVGAALLVALYRSRRWPVGLLASVVMWSSLWVHAVMTVLGVAAFFAYVVLDRVINRPPSWRASAGWCFLAVTPLLLTAAAASVTIERFGTLASDVEQLSDIATPGREIGPIQLWAPLQVGGIRRAGPEDAAAIFSRGHANTTQGTPNVVFLANGWPMAHPKILLNPRYLLLAVAVLVIVVGRHRDPVAVWVLATTLLALSVYVLPPAAALAARVVTPWQLYRFAWLMPVPLSVAWLVGRWLRVARGAVAGGAMVGLVLGVVLSVSPHEDLLRTSPAPSASSTAETVEELEGRDGVLMAPGSLMSAAASRWPDLDAISFRGLSSMSNAFWASEQADSLRRVQAARGFYMNIATSERSEILEEYQVRWVIIAEIDAETFDLDALGLVRVDDIGHGKILYERPAQGSVGDRGGTSSL